MSEQADSLEVKAASRYASRKFLLTVATLAATWTALVLGLLTAAETIDMTKWTLGLYMAGNVGTWVAEAIKGRP